MTDEGLELRLISKNAVPQAVKKAEHYRLLNAPELAESICLDVLAVDPDNQQARVVVLLAITDQFGQAGATSRVKEAFDHLDRLTDPYQREYYGGLIHEREARSYLARRTSRIFAYDTFREAMESYEKAVAIRPEGDDDALLRWNACVRTIRQERLHPLPQEAEQPLE